jgi:RNA polymerase sigma-70 factor (ECF subfamily)
MRDLIEVEEIDRLFSEHSVAIRRYALRRLNDPSSCEDVVSETFFVAWRRISELPERNCELRWLYAIAFRILSNQRRSRDRRGRLRKRLALERPLKFGVGNDEYPFIGAGKMRSALNRLRTSDRKLLEFVYWEKLNYRDIAEIIGISENAVCIRICRARKSLKSYLSATFFESPDLELFAGDLDS